MSKFSRFFAAGLLVLAGLWPHAANAGEVWPALPAARGGTVTVTTPDFLKIPEAVEAVRNESGAAAFTVAQTAPVVDIAWHSGLPDAANNGTGWTSWGDIAVASDGRVYCGIGNHGRNDKLPEEGGGYAFVYRFDPATKKLEKVVDVNAVVGVRAGDPTWTKIHAGILEAGDGQIYFTCTLNDGGRSFKTVWSPHVPGGQLFRYDPQSGKTSIVGTFPGEVTPTTRLDKERGLWFANMEGKTAATDVALTVFDLRKNEIVYRSENTLVKASRNLALARDGSVFFNGDGGLWKWDVATKTAKTTASCFPEKLTMRSSTPQTKDGFIYGTTSAPGLLFRYDSAADKLEMLGPDFLKGDYTTVTVLSPDEKFLYYLPGAHGGAMKIGTPVVQYNIATGERKVLAFLREGIEKATGYTPAGTYGVKMSSDGATLYVNFNGSPVEADPAIRHAKGFGLTAFAAIHIPPSER